MNTLPLPPPPPETGFRKIRKSFNGAELLLKKKYPGFAPGINIIIWYV
jgi:hypothetical protein